MLYRVRIDLSFATEEEAEGIYKKAETLLNKAIKIAGKDEETGESSYVELHKCYHDETPTKPCEIILRIEV